MDYRVISTDDHLQEDRYTWTSRMSEKKWGDKIPQVRETGDGTETWYIYGQRKDQTVVVAIVHGVMPDKTKAPTRWEDVPEIAYVPAKRIEAMDRDGVDVHTFFANVAGVAGHGFSSNEYDEAFRLEAIQAYNDYQIEEWAASRASPSPSPSSSAIHTMWESDYPHPTGTWLDSRKYIEASMQGWTDEEGRKVLVENAVRVFNLAA